MTSSGGIAVPTHSNPASDLRRFIEKRKDEVVKNGGSATELSNDDMSDMSSFIITDNNERPLTVQPVYVDMASHVGSELYSNTQKRSMLY